MGTFSFFKVIGVALLSALGFAIIFNLLNMSVLRLFVPIQNFTSKLNNKKLYNNLALIVLLVLSAAFRMYFQVSDIVYGLIIGFFFALVSICFSTQIQDNNNEQ